MLTWVSSANASQGDQQELTYLDFSGSSYHTTTPNAGKLHVRSGLQAVTAAYYRGLFDGVEEDIDDVGFIPHLDLTLQLWHGEHWLRALNLTFGTSNGLSDESPFDGVESPESWYSSDNYVGLSSRLGKNWLAGATYTAYTSPNGVFSTTEEVALATRYIGNALPGQLRPQVKVARRIDENAATYAEIGVSPGLKLLGDRAPLTVSAPIVFGVGFDDYYGADADTSGFVSIALVAAKSLGFIPSDYGNWTFTVDVNAVVREDALVEAEAAVVDDDNTILSTSVGVSVTY